ncbi:hypothetical protein BD777DRAFT_47203 [Yarrowia lipolytica]|nr:hypothetical protein BD777DRAFT_47203 [Yarrowia lipolytica]
MVAHWISVLMNDVLQRLRVRVLSSSIAALRQYFFLSCVSSRHMSFVLLLEVPPNLTEVLTEVPSTLTAFPMLQKLVEFPWSPMIIGRQYEPDPLTHSFHVQFVFSRLRTPHTGTVRDLTKMLGVAKGEKKKADFRSHPLLTTERFELSPPKRPGYSSRC